MPTQRGLTYDRAVAASYARHRGVRPEALARLIEDSAVDRDSRVLEVPLTLVNRFWDKWPPGLLRRIDPINRIQTVALNVLVRKRLRCSWLRPTFATAAEMLALTEYMRGRVGEDRLVLCMMFHSNEATAGMSPYHATAGEVEGFLARLSGYLEAVFSRFEVKPVGLSDLAADR